MKRITSYITRVSGFTVLMVGSVAEVAHAQLASTIGGILGAAVGGGILGGAVGGPLGSLAGSGASALASKLSPTSVLDFLGYSGGITGFLLQIFANLINLMLSIAAWFLALAGATLNLSLVLTIHIKDFVDATPAIYQAWAAIRDVSGILLIFFLLFAAIQLILGMDAKFSNLIKNLVIAGVLINFSFFAVSVLIDASNVVSLSIYDAMVPSNLRTETDANTQLLDNGSFAQGTSALAVMFGQGASSVFNDGGLSAIFMQNLQIQTLYQNGTINTSQDGSTLSNAQSGASVNTTSPSASSPSAFSSFLQISMAGVLGIIIMIVTALSFFAAAAAFIVRFVILLLLLAFSSVWCGAAILPGGKLVGKYWDLLWSQLIFMPAYLLLMWVALVILNGGESGGTSLLASSSAASGGAPWYFGLFTLTINYAIVAIMLAIPLIVAIQLGGASTGWIKKSRFDPRVAWKSVRDRGRKTATSLGSNVASRTVGRAAYSLNDSTAVKKIASVSPLAGRAISGGLTSVSKSGFGVKKGGSYEDRLKARSKAEEDLHDRIGKVDRSKYDTEEKYQTAKRRAEGYQKDYRENLPWSGKGPVKGVIGFMLDDRANRQTALSLTDEADLKRNTAKRDEIDRQINQVGETNRRKNTERRDAIDKEIKRLGDELVLTDVERTQLKALNEERVRLAGESKLTDEEYQKLEALKKERVEVDQAIGRASGKKKKQDITNLAKLLGDETKKGDEGGGEEKPKPEEKKEE